MDNNDAERQEEKRWERYFQTRKWFYEHIKIESGIFTEKLIYISSGAIGISMIVFDNWSEKDITGICILLTAWILLAIGIGLIVFSSLISVQGTYKAIENLDAAF